jgi:hypothetical protein
MFLNFLSIHSQLLALANAKISMNSKVSEEVIRNFLVSPFIIFALMIKIEGSIPSITRYNISLKEKATGLFIIGIEYISNHALIYYHAIGIDKITAER